MYGGRIKVSSQMTERRNEKRTHHVDFKRTSVCQATSRHGGAAKEAIFFKWLSSRNVMQSIRVSVNRQGIKINWQILIDSGVWRARRRKTSEQALFNIARDVYSLPRTTNENQTLVCIKAVL